MVRSAVRCVSTLMVRRRVSAVSNHEAQFVHISSFETPASQAPQDEGLPLMVRRAAPATVMPGHSPSKTGVNALKIRVSMLKSSW
jgi:hypothetical protein